MDRYAYVNNSPINYTDPSGHICTGDECGRITPISVALYVNLSTSLNGATGPGAQYNYTNGIIPVGHYNLCGDIALEMVYETISSKKDTLDFVYQGSAGTTRQVGDGTNAYELGQQFAGSFPSGWSTTAYYNSYVAGFAAGNTNNLFWDRVEKSLTQYSMMEIILKMAGMLSKGHYVIAGVSQDASTGAGATGLLDPEGVGHWVVVTQISGGYVYINNPFTNTQQKYNFEDFYNSFENWILELIPPPKPRGGHEVE